MRFGGKLLGTLVLGVSLFLFAGCAGVIKMTKEQFLKNDLLQKHPEWSPDHVKAIKEGNIERGMTKDQILASWGYPLAKKRAGGPPGIHAEFWEYDRQQLYFHNEVLVDWL